MSITLIEKCDRVDVMFVGAHPDDLEFACGGTIALLASQGYKVGMIDLTDGEPTPYCDCPTVRLDEATRAGEVLGVHVRKVLPFNNRRLMDGFEERVGLATEFRRYRPKMVIGIGAKTPMHSPDHYQAMQITDAAIFYSRLTKWDEHFSQLPVHTIDCQMYYRLQIEPVAIAGGIGEITVDISETLEKKIAGIACYETQFRLKKDRLAEQVRSLAIATGFAAGVKAGEVFTSVRPLCTKDLCRTMGLA